MVRTKSPLVGARERVYDESAGYFDREAMRLRDDEGENCNSPKGQYLGSFLLTGP